MGLETVVNVVVNAGARPLTRTGFGTPLILGTSPRAGAELVRYYTTVAAVAADYDLLSPEYLMASRVLTQDKRPRQVAIGKRSTKPTQVFTLTPVAANNARYAVEVDGVSFEFTSDASGTQAEAAAGLLAAYGALGEALPMVAASASGGTAMTLTSDTVGVWHNVKVLTPGTISIKQTQGDAGVAGDLTTLLSASNDWYGVLTPFTSQAEVMAIAAWTEANRKLFFYASVDSDLINTTYNATTPDNDVGGALKSRAYARSVGFFQGSTGDFTDAAAMGRFFGGEPGSIVLNLLALTGSQALALTDPQQKNLTDRNVNPYILFADSPALLKGKAANGTFADLVRDTDNFVRRTQEDVFLELRKQDKVPYTEAGVLIIKNAVSGRAGLEETSGFLAPGWTVTADAVADVDQAAREERRFPGIYFTGTRAGAIQSVDPLTVTFLV